jgi:hypothetical protein
MQTLSFSMMRKQKIKKLKILHAEDAIDLVKSNQNVHTWDFGGQIPKLLEVEKVGATDA